MGGGESGTNGGIDGSEGTPVGGDPPALLELDGKERSIRDNLSKEHPLTILMTIASRVPRFFWVPLICFLTGVITAPITEEFIFRVLLQGAAEKIFRVPWGAIAFSALLFAVIHYRTPFALNSADRLNVILKSIAIVPLAHLLILLLGVLWLRRVVGATWSELGFCRRGMLRDFGRGVVAFFFLAPIIFLTQSALGALFPDLVTDPAAILILAIGLGILYRQTGSLSAVVGTHSALNFVSFCGVLMAIRSGGL